MGLIIPMILLTGCIVVGVTAGILLALALILWAAKRFINYDFTELM